MSVTRRRLRLVGIVAAAAAVAWTSALIQACKSAAKPSEPSSSNRPVTIVVEHAPKASDSSEPPGSDGVDSDPSPEGPAPRKTKPADSTIIYE